VYLEEGAPRRVLASSAGLGGTVRKSYVMSVQIR